MARARRRATRSRSRHRWRWRRTALTVLTLVGGVIILPAFVLVPLRFVPPPTTAFILRYQLSGAEREPLAHVWNDWDEISPQAALAVMAAEDQRFPDHAGFDMESVREALGDAWRGGSLRGASTISQQVAKNLFLWPGRSVVRKGLEAILTVELELLWSKRRILEVYLNVAEFGDGVFGVGAASQQFFGKPPADLTEAEAALLAAVLPSPSRLRASGPSPYVRERQVWIREHMQRLQATGVLTRLD